MSRVILHGRRATPFVENRVAKRTGLLIVSNWRSNPQQSITVGLAIASTVLMLAPGVPGQMKPILGSTYFLLASAMAYRVLCAVHLGHIKYPQVNVAKISSVVSYQHFISDDDTTCQIRSYAALKNRYTA
ncbi:hypothetical protein PILCRDRAFT_256471 [Piloderma croceum F 1598]|uniref:Uncharacterized protein n=1 Tax=Piloderma croceum (strain F 1598) TaxID=765440 RepID=A0A0C3BPK1_PILCF|nr:hypothetical protein PILCRDRAFT_256471 [Piloderma croceum F 1598]